MKTPSVMRWVRDMIFSSVFSLLRRLVGLLFHLLVVIFNRCDVSFKRLGNLEKRESCVLRRSVLWRWKNVSVSQSSPSDFLAWSRRDFAPLRVLLRPDVTLYCVTSDSAVFVRCPPACHIYSSALSPFFYLAQFFHAEEIYLTSLRCFHRLAAEIAEDCRVPVTWLSSTGRCGSTMLAQIMERVPGTVSISEPDAILNIAAMAKSGQITSEQKRSLLKSAISLLVFSAQNYIKLFSTGAHEIAEQPHFRVFIKTRAECLVLVEDIRDLFPCITHVFMYRRLTTLLESFKQFAGALRTHWVRLVDSDVTAAVTSYFRMSTFLREFYGCEEEKNLVLDLVPYLSFVAIMVTALSSQLKRVQRLQTQGCPFPALLYDDILSDPTKTVGNLFDYLQIPREHLPAALTAMKKRSQSGLSGVDTKKSPSVKSRDQLTSREWRDVQTVLSRFELPQIEDEVRFTQRVSLFKVLEPKY